MESEETCRGGTTVPVIPSEARNLALAFLERSARRRARFLAEFTLSRQSEILRFAQDDSEGPGMTEPRRLHTDPRGEG
jgi:hypothetical protein